MALIYQAAHYSGCRAKTYQLSDKISTIEM